MKMGEVVEDGSNTINQQQHLQVASTVRIEDDEDEDDAENVRVAKEFSKSLATLSLKYGSNSDATDNCSSATNSNNLSSTSSSRTVGICPFNVLLPKHLERKRKSLVKKYLQVLKKTRGKGQLQSTLKAKKLFDLKFLEATYIRNVLYQSLPHSTDASPPHNASSSPLVNNVSGDCGSSRVSSDSKLSERTFVSNDHFGTVPRCSVIPERKPSGGNHAWIQCLKSKTMNARKPNHLVHAAYDQTVSSKRKQLSSQPKRSRSPPIVPDKGPTTVSTATLDENCSDDSKTSSSTSNALSKFVLSDNSRPALSDAASIVVSLESNVSTPAPAAAAAHLEKTDSLPAVNNLEQMRSRSLDKDSQGQTTSKEDPNHLVPAVVTSNSTSKTNSHEAEASPSPVAVAVAISKEEFDKGRKSSASSSYLTAAVLNNSKKGTTVSDVTKSVTASSSSSSSNTSELSFKSVISENTDSSSSTSTNASSNSCSDSANSIVQSSSGNGTTSSSSSTGPLLTFNLSNGNSKANAEPINELATPSSSSSAASSSSHSGHTKGNKKLGTSGASGDPKAPKKYNEKMKAEASVMQRIAELQKEGMWWEKRLPKVYEPPRPKSHWDYLLEEMHWMATDFASERKWKRNAAKKCARNIEKYFHDKEMKRQKAEKEEEARTKRSCAAVAKLIKQFWTNVQTIVELKEQTMIESVKKKALDQKLSYLVNETEKYSEIVAQTFTTIAKQTGIQGEAEVNDESKQASSEAGSEEVPMPLESIKQESQSSSKEETDPDAEFVPPSDSESDVDDTIAEEEAKEQAESLNHKSEIDELEAEQSMSYEELLAKYASYIEDPERFKDPVEDVESEPKKSVETKRVTRGRVTTERQLRNGRKIESPNVVESDIETDVDDASASSSDEESQDEEPAESDAEENNDDLASLVKSISNDNDQRGTSEETNKLADLAESFKPKGNTLSSTTVVTKVPHLLRHQLREYQHIGLDWLVAMYDKKLNGILADEMGLGKTIQTIALLAYLAVDRGNWGPHLIIVPTSVMLNWEMEFKKWCPSFKILTYYGNQKERKLKRSGWTKPNAFHVCITSYKLVIQDHQSFRRKRWKYLILDEAQNIKNFKSQRWQYLLNFHTQRRLLLTGTPLQNNLMELWSLLHFLMPNVFQSHMEFKDWFSNPMSGMVEGSQEYNEDIVRRLHKVLRPFILRRMKSEVEKQLPQKYEHVVMCSLSKRQRYLYEEFMSRQRTRDTLNKGNLLNVINILMQLRKVCNHPNLFEPRPIVSPLQIEGINYSLPSLVWDLVREIQEDSFRQYFPLFTVSNLNVSFRKDDADLINELIPLFAYNPDEERHFVVMNYQQPDSRGQQPPAKRVKGIVNLYQNQPPPCPRLQKPLKFFMTTGPPEKYLQDPDFMDYIKKDAAEKQNSPVPSTSAAAAAAAATTTTAPVTAKKETDENGGNQLKRSHSSTVPSTQNKASSSSKPVQLIQLESESEDDKSSYDSDFEVQVVKKRKVATRSYDICTILSNMGVVPQDFEVPAIQERKLQDRKLVVDNLNKVNWARCRVQQFANRQLLQRCQIVGALPNLRLTSRKCGIRCTYPKDRPRNYDTNGYFKHGCDDITRLIRIRQENPEMLHHPRIMGQTTKYLDELITTPERRLEELMGVIKRYVMYIPAVSTPAQDSIVYRPNSTRRYFQHLNQLDEYRKQFSKSAEIVHPILSRMHTHFPDPRLIQYDCGKLQTLDRLLRQLKTGNHRVLIFTQMAKVLDILEAFLNYHGHTYLRLDGATKIDQRQLLMERFNADKKIFCFILSTRSGGIGVNLTGADTVIFYDSDWNPTMDAQAQDRCHRIGQTRDVHIYRLVSEMTVEENILKKSNQKRLLGELAIEGGKFTTTFFKQHTIRELFAINDKEDVAKRLNTWNVDPTSSAKNRVTEEEEDTSMFDSTDLMRSPEKRHEMQLIECALAAAEDDTDVQAAQTVHAEAEAEMAEFDENISLDALDDGKSGPNKFDQEFAEVYNRLNAVERFAIKKMESTIEDWSKETLAQAQKDIEEQKVVWELQQQQKNAQESSSKMDIDDDSCATEDLVTYSRLNNLNQVWVAQIGSIEQEMLFPIYEPPTPPHDDMDVYFDTAHGYLYDYGIMNEDQLPPVYVVKQPKKPVLTTPLSDSPVPKQVGGVELPDPVVKAPSSPKETTEPTLSTDETSPQKKSPKAGRREDSIFAPKSLFDKPSPQYAKMRRDLRLARYGNRPASHSPKTALGPGSITFPIVPTAQKMPPPPAPKDSPDWMLVEDNVLYNTVKNVQELPTNLMPINNGQTPNWDYAHEAVNHAGLTYRTTKQCKYRYENFIGPREEGKLVFNTMSVGSASPSSPSAGKKKKSKQTGAFIKICPPETPKDPNLRFLADIVDEEKQLREYRDIFSKKFDTVKSIANKRAPTTKPVSVAAAIKTSNKHAQAMLEYAIDYDNPISAPSIAMQRNARIVEERKRQEVARQQQQQQIILQQATAVVAATTAPVVAANSAMASGAGITHTTTLPLSVQQQQQQPTMSQTLLPPPSTSASAANAAPASAAVAAASKPRGQFTSVSMTGGITPLVMAQNTPDTVQIHRDVNIPNIIAQQRSARQQQELTPQQQASLLQQKIALANMQRQQQQQQLQSILNQQQQHQREQQHMHQQMVVTQQSLSSPNQNVTVLTAGSVMGPNTPQQSQAPGIRPSNTPQQIQVQQSQQTQQQTVVLATAAGFGQALAAASVGSPISVSNSTMNTSTPMTTVVSSTAPSIPTPVSRHVQSSMASQQQQLQRVPTLTMQDIVSSAAVVSTQQRLQSGTVITTTTPIVPAVVSSQSPSTLVSLTPMIGAGSQQLATAKLIQNSQGLAAAFVPTGSPTRAGAPSASALAALHNQQTGNKVGVLQSPLQPVYLRQEAIPRQQTLTLNPQHPTLNLQQMNTMIRNQQGFKQIQIVPAASTSTMVSGTSSIAGQPPQNTVSLPSISTITSGAQYSTMPTVVAATSSPVPLSVSGVTTSKVSLPQSNVTMAISSPNVSTATASAVVQQQQRQVQLVKQHTVGGKTVTRPVTDAEVAAFLKHHGIPAITNPVNAQSVLPGSPKAPTVATFQSSVPVQGSPALLTVGLQNVVKVQQSTPGSVATLVKNPTGQTSQNPAASQALTFPVHMAKLNTKGPAAQGPPTSGSPKQQVQTLSGVQQLMTLRRQQQDPVTSLQSQNVVQQQQPPQPQTVQAPTSAAGTPVSVAQAGKIATMQVTPQGTLPTHVVVQTTQKQLPNTIAVQQLQQVFKQVGTNAQVLQAQMLGKPIAVSGPPNTITVTSSGGVTSSQSPMTIPPSPSASSAPSLVHIPNLVQAGGGIHARIVPVSVNLASQQPGNVKPTLQVVSGAPPQATLISASPISVRPPPPPVSGSNVPPPVNSVQMKIPAPTQPPPNPDEKNN